MLGQKQILQHLRLKAYEVSFLTTKEQNYKPAAEGKTEHSRTYRHETSSLQEIRQNVSDSFGAESFGQRRSE